MKAPGTHASWSSPTCSRPPSLSSSGCTWSTSRRRRSKVGCKKGGLHPCFHYIIIGLFAGMGELCSVDGGDSVCSETSLKWHLLIVATSLLQAHSCAPH